MLEPLPQNSAWAFCGVATCGVRSNPRVERNGFDVGKAAQAADTSDGGRSHPSAPARAWNGLTSVLKPEEQCSVTTVLEQIA